MRLFKSGTEQEFEFTKDFEEEDLRPYAILSHTLGTAEEEVTYTDIVNRMGRHKSGYSKLAFCAEQALRNGQTYFWVVTCCIDKSNNVELNTTITSMFRWYQEAVKCYVYLSDVPKVITYTETDTVPRDSSCLDDFQGCRWLTQGWTLQELLAPEEVLSFDKNGRKLGDKASLEQHLCDITVIPAAALRGRPISSFSIEERFAWRRSRQTKKAEDQAYSLPGLCGVSVIPKLRRGTRPGYGKIAKGDRRVHER
jgi:hypothetical protein